MSSSPKLDERRRDLADVEQRIAAMDARYPDRQFPGNVRDEWNALNEERDSLAAEVVELERRHKRIMQFANNPNATEQVNVKTPSLIGRLSDDPWRSSVGSLESRAVAAAEALHKAGKLPDFAAERVEKIVKREGDKSASFLLAISDPAYERAFGRMILDPETGFSEFDDRERAAWRRVREESRAMEIGTDITGGHQVPIILDPAIILTNDGSENPLRDIARVEQIVTSEWRGITSEGATAEWLPESTEAADGSPQVDQPKVKAEKGSVFVPFSVEWETDAAQAIRELSNVIRDAAANLMADAYTVGDGTDKPFGVITGATETVNTGGAFSAANVTALQNALPPRFQGRARWAANLAVLNAIEAFETTNGHLRFPSMQSTPPTLLRKPVHELSDMTSNMTTASSKFLLYGDFRQFLIVDRVGTRLEIVRHLIGTNRRPTGQRGAWLWFRTGSKVLVPEAFRLLNKT